MALRPRLSPGVPLSRVVATVGIGTEAVKHLLLQSDHFFRNSSRVPRPACRFGS